MKALQNKAQVIAARKKALMADIHMSNIKLNTETPDVIKRVLGFPEAMYSGPGMMINTGSNMEID